ncbi:unnamed protein product [Dibothriocephalus latus]|uniref:Uncharacterized protein n=1 Tax=Dibothriocephalus latus TaxID=60516 RepID=A0A3P7P2T2_DIBLA|nr:unnamed protein product [Dibothriocephalus latus]
MILTRKTSAYTTKVLLQITILFEEDPQFEYVAQSNKEIDYSFISPERGDSGVFELDEMTKLLRKENLDQIVCLKLPKTACLGDFMIIANAKSKRHLSQTTTVIQKLFKMKRNPTDPLPVFEGLRENSDWVATDLVCSSLVLSHEAHSDYICDITFAGNIVLHLFSSSATRETYSLESLWGAGPEFDEQTQGFKTVSSETDGAALGLLSQTDWEQIIAEVRARKATETSGTKK